MNTYQTVSAKIEAVEVFEDDAAAQAIALADLFAVAPYLYGVAIEDMMGRLIDYCRQRDAKGAEAREQSAATRAMQQAWLAA